MNTQFNTFIITFNTTDKEGKPKDRMYQINAESLSDAQEKSFPILGELALLRGFKVENVKIQQLHNIPALD